MNKLVLQEDSDLKKWAMDCPDPNKFAQIILRRLYLLGKQRCYECGEKFPRLELRPDVAYISSGELICKSCWHFHDSGTLTRPDYKAPEWPKEFEFCTSNLFDGTLVDKKFGIKVGEVKGFNPETGMCKKVIRIGYEDLAETGSINLEEEKVINLSPLVPTKMSKEMQTILKIME